MKTSVFLLCSALVLGLSASLPATDAVVAERLTPKEMPTPRINGPKVFGVRPGSPFLYAIPATGERPMTFAADHLPAGLSLDSATGRITGTLKSPGEYIVTLRANNALGSAAKAFRIVVGDTLALTPPMGWNSWNCWAGAVDQEKVLRSAHALVSSGLARHGWTYINIDDTWQGKRGGEFNAIQPNEKFSDMKLLCDEIHALGLKAGIYSTPWVTSYGRHIGGSSENPEGSWTSALIKGPRNKKVLPYDVGKFSFAANDAAQWAAWGFDYLKYDWNPIERPQVLEMAEALKAARRDIVFSLSNNSRDRLLDRIADIAPLAQAWRTTGDINDSWGSMSGIGFNQSEWAPFSSPGHWNDPDMLVVGWVGWGPKLHATKLTPDEQYTHISLWCLLSAPLLIGCDLEKLDDFTLSLLTNDEVLEIDQDTLGKPAVRASGDGERQIYVKPLDDGSVAVGLFNIGNEAAVVTANWVDLKLTGKHRVRDLWRQKDLGEFTEKFEASVAPHGVVFVRLFPVAEPAAPVASAKTFIDYFLPIPAQGPLSSEVWGAPGVLPRDPRNGLENLANNYCYWDGQILKAADGKYHLFASRWDEALGHNGWLRSVAVSAVSEHLLGPYTDQGLCWPDSQGGKGHNVTALTLPDGRYAVVISETRPGTVFVSKSLDGPWAELGTIVTEGDTRRRASNYSVMVRPDGDFQIVPRSGQILISKTGILGPYRAQGPSIYPSITHLEQRDLEDPVVWFSGGRYHIVVNSWSQRKAYHLTSRDGITGWTLRGLAYDPNVDFVRYTDGTVNRWEKLERPGVVLENGHVVAVTLAVLDVPKDQEKGGDRHGNKVIVIPFDGAALDRDLENAPELPSVAR